MFVAYWTRYPLAPFTFLTEIVAFFFPALTLPTVAFAGADGFTPLLSIVVVPFSGLVVGWVDGVVGFVTPGVVGCAGVVGPVTPGVVGCAGVVGPVTPGVVGSSGVVGSVTPGVVGSSGVVGSVTVLFPVDYSLRPLLSMDWIYKFPICH